MILVDDRPTRGVMGRDFYHLATDNGLEELYLMAYRLGLRRHWLHDHPGIPHYDIPEAKKRIALQMGAVEVSTRELVRRCKR